ncbi:dienelactone hydrolase family protein [Sphingomonas sp.]|uniref:dienelactone hydrolase family protein n=1 Tax=Sphingomonas sp. TaxID=28214 RepID=UPI002FC5B91B
MGEWIDISGSDFKGYLALPASGSGPGILLLQEIFGINQSMRDVADLYAEEGYVVLAPDLFWRIEPGIELGYSPPEIETALGYFNRFDVDQAVEDSRLALQALRARPECRGGVGALGFCLGGTLSYLAAARTDVDCAVGYYAVGLQGRLEEAARIECPVVLHFAEQDRMLPPEERIKVEQALAAKPNIQCYVYPGCDHAFAAPGRPEYNPSATAIAHTRSLTLFRRAIGPHYDLEALWEQHTALEFAVRDAEATIKTMVPQPYVNHIPTMTGGVGHDDLLRFYRDFFIAHMPLDATLTPVSRTVGVDRLVDEFIFSFTHDVEIDWILPGIAPTGKKVEVAMLAVVRFRGDKLYNEHIYWDQASVLVQVGLLDGTNLPVLGAEAARKVLDKTLPSNRLIKDWAAN